MNKNLIIGTVVVLIIVAAGAFFIFKDGGIIDVSVWRGDEAELANGTNDLEISVQDDIFAIELNQTFNDILDEQTAISANAALNESAIAQEANQIDFSQTLNDFAADDTAIQELGQIFGEVSR